MRWLWSLLVLSLFLSCSLAQSSLPRTYAGDGLRIISYDSLRHRTASDYLGLFWTVCDEYNLPKDTPNLVIVFVSEALRDSIMVDSPNEWDEPWYGTFINPNIIVLAHENSSSLYHEIGHALHNWGWLFQEVPSEYLESMVRRYEHQMLFSKSHINWLRGH